MSLASSVGLGVVLLGGCGHSGGGGGGFLSTASTNSSFATAQPLSTPRTHHASVLLASGEVLVIGGQTGASSVSSTTEVFDPATRTTRAGPSMASARMNHAAIVLPNQKVLVVGGQSDVAGQNALDTTELYDPQTGQFAPGPTLSEQRSGPALAPFSQAGIARVLIAGGEHGNVASRTAELYLVDSNTLSPVAASMVEGRFEANAVTLVSGTTILLQGGWSASGGGAVPASSEIYDVTSQTFSPTPSLVSRAESTLVAVGSSTYAVGGTDGTNVLGSVEVFDGSQWSPASLSLLVARRAHTATALNGQILVTGGYDTAPASSGSLAPLGSSALGSSEILGAGAAAGLQAGRAYHTATALSNGELVVIGGEDGPAILASIEVYGANTTPTPAGSTAGGSTAATSSSSHGAKAPGQGNGNGQGQNAQGQNGNGHPAAPATGAPGISQVSPAQAAPGQAIMIQGIGFDPTAANDAVVIGGAAATVLTAAVNPSHDQLQVTVPATLKPGPVTVTVTVGGKTSTAVNFTVR